MGLLIVELFIEGQLIFELSVAVLSSGVLALHWRDCARGADIHIRVRGQANHGSGVHGRSVEGEVFPRERTGGITEGLGQSAAGSE